MKNLAIRFVKYINKVYNLSQQLLNVNDGRTNPSVPIGDVLLALILGFGTRMPSFNVLEYRIKNQFKKVLSNHPSADTLGYAISMIGIDSLKQILFNTVNKARRNKVFRGGTIDGYKVAAIDGSGIYSTRVPQDESLWKRIEDKENGPYWRVDCLALTMVGDDTPSLLFNLEPIKPGEGETTAALRVLKEAYLNYTHFCDIITLDSLYAKAPIIRMIREQGKHAVIRVKQENYNIINDIEGMVKDEEPDKVYKDITPKDDQDEYSRYSYDLRIWDREDFRSWESLDEPIRCLKVEETKKRIVHGKVVEQEKRTIYLVTTCPKDMVSSLTIWKIAHKRWDIENCTFHDLKINWNFDHCFIHEPSAIIALWIVFAIAFNLFVLFYHRNLRSAKKGPMTVVAEIILSTIYYCSCFWEERWVPT